MNWEIVMPYLLSAVISFITSFIASLITIPIGIVIALWYEKQGDPKLIIEKENAHEGYDKNNKYKRYVRIKVTNKPKKCPLVTQKTAISCHGNVRFFNANGEQVGDRLDLRWDHNPQPLRYESVEGKDVEHTNSELFELSRYRDLPPNDRPEQITLAMRYLDKPCAYRWAPESYLYMEKDEFKNPAFILQPGKYKVIVTLFTGDKVEEKKYILDNSGKFENFDLVSVA